MTNYINTHLLPDDLLMLLNHPLRDQSALFYDLLDLPVDLRLHLLPVGFGVLHVREGHIAQGLAHSEFGHDMVSYVVGLLQIIVGSCCYLVEEEQLGTTATENEADSIQHLLFCLQLVLVDEVLGESECTFGSRDDGHLQKGVCSFEEPGNHGMTTFMVGHRLLFLHRHKAFPFDPSNHSFRG